MPIGTSFAAGTQELVRLTFTSVSYSSNNTALAFTDTPVPRELADATAEVLAASYQNATLAVAAAQPTLSISLNGGQVQISWPAAATNFVLESSSPLGTNWAGVNQVLSTNGQTISLTVPVANNAQFFRLILP